MIALCLELWSLAWVLSSPCRASCAPGRHAGAWLGTEALPQVASVSWGVIGPRQSCVSPLLQGALVTSEAVYVLLDVFCIGAITVTSL